MLKTWFYKEYKKRYSDLNVTENFKAGEFFCHDGSVYPIKWYKRLKQLCEVLEVIRSEFKKPIKITSGYRTVQHNKKVGGSKHSQHVIGKAADIKINGVSSQEIAQKAKELMQNGIIPKGGIGIYKSFVHIDTRGRIAVWRG
jgi:uncharacterized protein YcbK (DUF882 family)